eukprot:1160266-Pelagomonas_calceolata.AAC.10
MTISDFNLFLVWRNEQKQAHKDRAHQQRHFHGIFPKPKAGCRELLLSLPFFLLAKSAQNPCSIHGMYDFHCSVYGLREFQACSHRVHNLTSQSFQSLNTVQPYACSGFNKLCKPRIRLCNPPMLVSLSAVSTECCLLAKCINVKS